MYKVPEEWKLSDFLELSNDEKLKWLYNGVKNAGGGSDLPDVTSDDNGDVLTVVNGEWNKATPSGSSDAFEVNFTLVYDSETGAVTVTCDKTFSEISAAFTANKKIYAWLNDTDWVAYSVLNAHDFDAEYGGSFYFKWCRAPGATTMYTVTFEPESISVTVYGYNTPVYISGGFSFGSTLPSDILELHNAALINGSPVIISLLLADNDNNRGEFLISSGTPYGYCFAGTPGAIGATVIIDMETGLITGNPANE